MKYRIIKKDNMFYVQHRVCWLFWVYSFADYYGDPEAHCTLEEAVKSLQEHKRIFTKPKQEVVYKE